MRVVCVSPRWCGVPRASLCGVSVRVGHPIGRAEPSDAQWDKRGWGWGEMMVVCIVV